jgi:hypothetical protein
MLTISFANHFTTGEIIEILKEQYHSVFARLPRSKLRGMRSLPKSNKKTRVKARVQFTGN